MNKKNTEQLEKEINTRVKDYYSPKNQNYLLSLRRKTLANLSKKEITYLKQLEIKFKKLVLLRNQLAKIHGHDNYFDFIVA